MEESLVVDASKYLPHSWAISWIGAPSGSDAVFFDMWGQRCLTFFGEDSELHWLTWIQRMWEKGWLYPVAVRTKDGREYNKEELRAMMGDL